MPKVKNYYLDTINVDCDSSVSVWRSGVLWTIIHIQPAGKRCFLVSYPESQWACLITPSKGCFGTVDLTILPKYQEEMIESPLHQRMKSKTTFMENLNAVLSGQFQSCIRSYTTVVRDDDLCLIQFPLGTYMRIKALLPLIFMD